MTLPSAEELFSTQESRDDARRERIQQIPLAEIDDFPEHPFHVRDDESMAVMVESIRTVGVQTPLLVRPRSVSNYRGVTALKHCWRNCGAAFGTSQAR
jgi:ParB family chromosome partitioning protein